MRSKTQGLFTQRTRREYKKMQQTTTKRVYYIAGVATLGALTGAMIGYVAVLLVPFSFVIGAYIGNWIGKKKEVGDVE